MTRLHYEQAGDRGPRVLMIQGTGVAGCGWSPQVEQLRHDHQLAWFDNRGVGASPGASSSLDEMAEDALEVLDALGWEDAHVVGHSLGGLIAQALVLRAPERVRSLGLLCTLLDGRASLGLSPSRAWVQMRTAVGTRAMRRRAFFEMVSDPRIEPTEEHITTLESAFGRSLEALPPVAYRQVRIVMSARLASQLEDVDVPSLVMSATHDMIAPLAQGRALADVLGAEFVEVAGGHAVTVQDAPRVNSLLADFWAEVEAQRTP